MQEAMFRVKARAHGDGPYLPGAEDSDLHMSSIRGLRALQKKDRCMSQINQQALELPTNKVPGDKR